MMDTTNSSNVLKETKRQTRPIRLFFKKCVNDWSFDFASMIAYSLLVTIFPIAVTILGIIGFILNDNSQAQSNLKNQIINSFPSDNTTQTAIKQVVDLAFDKIHRDAGGVFAMGIIFSILSASRLFVSIDKCLTIIYRVPERTFLRQILLSIGLLLLFLILIVLLLIGSSFPTALMNTVLNDGNRFGVFLSGIILSILIAFILFQMIYLLTPNKKMSFKKTWCGSLFGAITLEIFVILFPLYVRQFLSNYAGQIGFGVILILFFYYFAIILILGGEINAYFFENIPPLEQPLGTFLNETSKEDSHRNIEESLHNENDEERISTRNNNEQQNRFTSLINKCCSFHKRNSIKPK